MKIRRCLSLIVRPVAPFPHGIPTSFYTRPVTRARPVRSTRRIINKEARREGWRAADIMRVVGVECCCSLAFAAIAVQTKLGYPFR